MNDGDDNAGDVGSAPPDDPEVLPSQANPAFVKSIQRGKSRTDVERR